MDKLERAFCVFTLEVAALIWWWRIGRSFLFSYRPIMVTRDRQVMRWFLKVWEPFYFKYLNIKKNLFNSNVSSIQTTVPFLKVCVFAWCDHSVMFRLTLLSYHSPNHIQNVNCSHGAQSKVHCRISYMLGKGGVRAGVFSWLQSATSPLDAAKSSILLL